MSKINILPPQVYNRIAAGEVIERPSSVVKELVENALDAGATEIEIHVEKAGLDCIRIVDNGSGMDRIDLRSAFLPHAAQEWVGLKLRSTSLVWVRKYSGIAPTFDLVK